MPTPYSTQGTSGSVTTTSAYIGGKSANGATVIATTAATPTVAAQPVFADGLIVPNTTPVSIPKNLLTSTRPRFGENVASPVYTPSILSVVPIGGTVPKEDTTSANAVAYFENTGFAPAYMASQLWPLFDKLFQTAINNPKFSNNSGASPVPAGQIATLQTWIATHSPSLVFSPTSVAASTSGVKNGIFVFNGSTTFVQDVGDNNGATDTLVVVLGDCVISGNVVANGTGLTVVFSTGKITFQSSIVTTGKVIAVSMKEPTGIVSSAVPPNVTLASPTNVPACPSGFTWATSAGPNVPGFAMLTPADGPVVGPGGVYKGTMFDYSYTGSFSISALQVGPTKSFSFVVNTGAGTAALPGVTGVFGSPAAQAFDAGVESFLGYQLMSQFSLDVLPEAKQLIQDASSSGGSYVVNYEVYGSKYQSFFCVQQSTGSMPNAGFATDAYNDNKYVKQMLRTYRVSEDGFAFCGSPAYYITLAATVSPGQLVFSDNALAVAPSLSPGLLSAFTTSYTLNDTAGTQITLNSTVGVIDTFPSASFPSSVANQGGVDPYAHSDEMGNYQSTYRLLQPQVSTTGETIVASVVINAPYESLVRYRPLNGKVTAVAGPVLVDEGEAVFRNMDRRSAMVSAICTVYSGLLTGTAPLQGGLMCPGMNVRHFFDYNTAAPLCIYADDKEAVILLQVVRLEYPYDTFEKTFSIKANLGPVDPLAPIGDAELYVTPGKLYSYVVDRMTGHGDLYWTTKADPTTAYSVVVGSVAILPSQPVKILVTVVFGDMVQEGSIKTFHESHEGFEYLGRDANGVVANAFWPLKVLGTTNTVDVTYHDSSDIRLFKTAGFIIDAYVQNEYRYAKRASRDSQPVINDYVLIYGCKMVEYPSNTTSVPTTLIPGYTYTTEDEPAKTVEVHQNGLVDLSAFEPSGGISIALTTYVAVPGAPRDPDYAFSGTGMEINTDISTFAELTGAGSTVPNPIWLKFKSGKTVVMSGGFNTQKQFVNLQVKSAAAGDSLIVTNGNTSRSYTVTHDF